MINPLAECSNHSYSCPTIITLELVNSTLAACFHWPTLLWEHLGLRAMLLCWLSSKCIFTFGEVAYSHKMLELQAVTNRSLMQWGIRLCNSRSELWSFRETCCSLVPTKLNSLSPFGAICVNVTHELSLPLLASGFWVRHDSRATAWARITPKTSAAPSCLRERDSECCVDTALWTILVETFCPDRANQACSQKKAKIKSCVKKKTPSSGSVWPLRDYGGCHFTCSLLKWTKSGFCTRILSWRGKKFQCLYLSIWFFFPPFEQGYQYFSTWYV